MELRINRKAYLDQLTQWREKEMIKVVTGVRRCGKSTLFSLYIDFLKSQGVSDEQIVCINLEDMDHADLLNDRSLHDYVRSRLLGDRWTYVFIDEVQNCADYERAVSSLFLREKTDIYLTGSNAHLLSGELATKLSGRFVEIKMLPFSFSEFSEAVEVSDPHERFGLYMNMGGFPYAAGLIDQSSAHGQYLEGIYNTVLVKDVLMRKTIGDSALLKSVVRFLADNAGNPVSAKKIADTLSSFGRPTHSSTVDHILSALTDAYLFYKVNRFDVKGKLHLKTECKYYICDTGLRNMILGTQGRDIGRQIENIVYLELIRRGYIVSIGKAGRSAEIDFVAVRDKNTEYFQVSASVLDETTLQREIRPFDQIEDHYPKYLLTLDKYESDHEGIRQKNLVTWLLEE